MLKKYIKPELLVTDFGVDDILRTSSETLLTGINGETDYRDLGEKTYNDIFGSSDS